MSDNVIKGPWSDRLVTKSEKDWEAIASVEHLSNEISEAIFEAFRQAGLDKYLETRYTKDLALMTHSISSVLFRLEGDRYHPCQDIAEQIFTQYDDDSVSMNSSVNVSFE